MFKKTVLLASLAFGCFTQSFAASNPTQKEQFIAAAQTGDLPTLRTLFSSCEESVSVALMAAAEYHQHECIDAIKCQYVKTLITELGYEEALKRAQNSTQPTSPEAKQKTIELLEQLLTERQNIETQRAMHDPEWGWSDNWDPMRDGWGV